jgi:uncharacterized protein (DUF2147 family)
MMMDVTVKFTGKLIDNTEGRNYFKHLPNDLTEFLDNEDGVMIGIVERLESNKYYEIKISIKEVENKS